jgi:U4/U6.U5 tri-snRNP component SNU23
MSDSKNKSAYGVAASDTDFRKNWDLDEYAAKAKEREAKEKEEAKARYEAKLAGKKYHKPMTGNETYTSARRNIIDVSAQVGKTQIVPAGSGVGKRGRGAGFYCEACDLTFKDNLQWVEVCTRTYLSKKLNLNMGYELIGAYIAFEYDSASAQHRADHRS